MKNKFRFAKLLVIAFAIVFVGCKKQEPLPGHSVLGNQLLALKIVGSLDTIIPNQNPANFKELYKIKFTQPIDHNNPSSDAGSNSKCKNSGNLDAKLKEPVFRGVEV